METDRQMNTIILHYLSVRQQQSKVHVEKWREEPKDRITISAKCRTPARKLDFL